MAYVKVGLSYSSEVVGCGGGIWGGGAAPSPVKKKILIDSVPAAGSRTGIIYCREIASRK